MNSASLLYLTVPLRCPADQLDGFHSLHTYYRDLLALYEPIEMEGFVSISVQPFVGLRINLPVHSTLGEAPEGIVARAEEIRNYLMKGCPFPGTVVIVELCLNAATGTWFAQCEPLKIADGAGLCDVALDLALRYGFEFSAIPPPKW